jgi:penicillin-binding protein 2
VDEITPQDIKVLQDDRLKPGQFIGRMGIERMYDRMLRGVDGGLQFEMDAHGRHVQVLRRVPSTPGNDVVLTLDLALQAAAERGLDLTNTGRGAVVAVDPRTGAVLALVSHPAFDPSGDLSKFLADPQLPFFNRALQGTYPPGSVFKTVTAMAALRDGWDIHKKIFCSGVFRLGTKEFGCWKKHGLIDFMDAMTWSCDVYHYNMGLMAGVDAMEELGRALGLGEPTGIDLPSEASGNLPGRAWKKKALKQPWYDGDTVNMSIGQGYLTVTPLQAAMLMSAVANGGTLWRPQVVDRVLSPEGVELYHAVPRDRRRLELPAEVWDNVRTSLQEVVRRGTGGHASRPDVVIGGKTGTAQNPHGEDHAWFAAYAGKPGEPASLVVVGFVENGGHGSEVALPVVREVLNEAFPLQSRGPDTKPEARDSGLGARENPEVPELR